VPGLLATRANCLAKSNQSPTLRRHNSKRNAAKGLTMEQMSRARTADGLA